MLPSKNSKIKYHQMEMSEIARKTLATKLPEALRNLPTEKWKMELSKRVKEILDSSNSSTDGPWHCAVGTSFALNAANKGNGFGQIMIGQYIHLVVWQTTEKMAMINEDTDLCSFDDDEVDVIPKNSGGGGATP